MNYHAREKDFDSVWYRTVDDDPIPKSIRKGREKKIQAPGNSISDLSKGYYNIPKVCVLYMAAGIVNNNSPEVKKKEKIVRKGLISKDRLIRI